MGRKPQADDKKGTEKQEKAAEPLTMDPPVVVDLKANDDKYLAIEQELEKEITKLRREFKAKLDPLLDERKKILDAPPTTPAEGDEAGLATPACKGFWFTALKRLPSTTDEIEEHDAPVLEYCCDVKSEDLDPLDENKGFKIDFFFVENPFFTNDTLTVEFVCKESNPYSKEMTCTEIKSTVIDWKPGKNITVEKVAKKKKGGGAKKKAKETEEPRDSFFRSTFRNLKLGDDIPDDLNLEEMMEEVDDEDEFIEQFLDNQLEVFRMVRDNLIPHAVRVYTGEAFPEEDDDDEDGEEEDDEDDETDDDEESEEKPVAKKKGSPKTKKKADGAQPKEECKQQ